MKFKIKHLRHPFQAIAAAKDLAKTYFDVRLFPYRSKLRFRGDSRYQLQNVISGFASRIENSGDDRELLERICTAYIKAAERQETAPERYQPSKWWRQVGQTSSQPVMQALQKRDIHALRLMYGNFFRDPCSRGLIATAHGMREFSRGGAIKGIHRHFYLGDSLSCIDYWKERTAGRFALADLAVPNIGNPFGVMLDGTLVRIGAPYQHYCAHRLSSQLDAGSSTVAEIGGGFGGMAYFLLRDRQQLTYFDFDLPESIALASYFLLKAFPSLTFLLYGEKQMAPEELARANVVLMPLFEMEKMRPRTVDVTFSSHAISDLPSEFIADYLEIIGRITRGHFLYIGSVSGAKSMVGLAARRRDMRMVETFTSGWNRHRSTNWKEVEILYRIGED